jgi:hypothetical protein
MYVDTELKDFGLPKINTNGIVTRNRGLDSNEVLRMMHNNDSKLRVSNLRGKQAMYIQG